MDETETLTAWHEAGHATMAIIQGGFVEHVTLEPPNDEGPNRYGETITRWPGRMSQLELLKSEILVSLAGPVVEILYSSERRDISEVAEWKADWIRAIASARSCTRSESDAQKLIQRCESEIVSVYEAPKLWSGVSAVAEELLAHYTLEHEQIEEAFSFWQRR